MHALLEKDIPKTRWLEELNRARNEGFTGIAVVYFKNLSSVSKTLLLYRSGEIINTVYEVEGKIFSGSPSLLLDRWYSRCEGVMDLYTLSEEKVESVTRNYENVFSHETPDISFMQEKGIIPRGEKIGTLSLSLLSMEEMRHAINKKRLNGYIECECGIIVFIEGEAYASVSKEKRGFPALREVMDCPGGDVAVFRYPHMDAVIKVGIPIDTILLGKKEGHLDSSLERIRKRIPTPEEIDEIMRRMAFTFGDDP